MKKEEAQGYIMIGGAVVVVIVVFVVLKGTGNAIGSVLETLGLKDSANDKRAENASAQAEKLGYWKDTYISSINPKTHTFKNIGTQAKADTMVKTIYDSIGLIYDSPEKIVGVFNQLAYKSQVCILAYNFRLKYKKDLLSFLVEKLDTEAQKKSLANILNYTNNLPSGIDKKLI